MSIVTVLILLTVIDVVRFAQTLNPTMDASEFQKAIASGSAVSTPVSEGRLFQVDEGKIWGAFISYRTYEALSSKQDREAFLQSLAPNLSTMSNWRDAAGYEPVRLASVDALWAPVQAAARKQNLHSQKAVMDAFSVGTLATWDRVAGNRATHTSLRSRGKGNRVSRAQFWADWRPVAHRTGASQIIHAGHWDGVPLVETDTEPERSPSQKSNRGVGLVVRDISADSVEIRLPKSHPVGLVVLSDAYYHGWSVTVDGEKTEPLCIDGAFRGVFIGGNSLVVQWTFDPVSWRLGLFISLLTVGIMTMITVPVAVGSIRHRRLMSRNGRD